MCPVRGVSLAEEGAWGSLVLRWGEACLRFPKGGQGLGRERILKDAKWQRSPFLLLLSLSRPCLPLFPILLYQLFSLDFVSRFLQTGPNGGHLISCPVS